MDLHSKEALALGEIGQIAFQSEAIMKGYFGLDKQPFSSNKDDLWLYTDDLGYMDQEGYIYFIDRLKRMLKISGYEVYPSKLEAMFTEISGITNACLVEYLDQGIAYLKLYLVIEKGLDPNTIKNKVIKMASHTLPPWSRPKKFKSLTAYHKPYIRKMIIKTR